MAETLNLWENYPVVSKSKLKELRELTEKLTGSPCEETYEGDKSVLEEIKSLTSKISKKIPRS